MKSKPKGPADRAPHGPEFPTDAEAAAGAELDGGTLAPTDGDDHPEIDEHFIVVGDQDPVPLPTAPSRSGTSRSRRTSHGVSAELRPTTVQQASKRSPRSMHISGLDSATRDARGNRRHSSGHEKVDSLAREHDLPRYLAAEVADGNLSLRTAKGLKRLRVSPDERTLKERAGHRTKLYAALGLVLLVGMVTAIVVKSKWNAYVATTTATADAPLSAIEPAEVTTESEQTGAAAAAILPASHDPASNQKRSRGAFWDEQGNMVRVVASSPQRALLDFCRFGVQCWDGAHIEIVRPARARAGLRYGVFREADQPERESAVAIHRHSRSGTWVVGDGRRVIPVFAVERLKLDLQRTEVAEWNPLPAPSELSMEPEAPSGR